MHVLLAYLGLPRAARIVNRKERDLIVSWVSGGRRESQNGNLMAVSWSAVQCGAVYCYTAVVAKRSAVQVTQTSSSP